MAVKVPEPWYAPVTIDLLAQLLARSIFHPFIAWLIPLTLGAAGVPKSSPKLTLTATWAAIVTLAHLFGLLSRRIAYGAPRKLDWTAEVVLITGGAGGLGRLLASMYGLRGVNVAVLDVVCPAAEERAADESLAEVRFYACDVGDADAVRRAVAKIEKELGRVTILINNAATAIHGQRLINLDDRQLSASWRVNVLGHFNTIRACLPSMLGTDTTTCTIDKTPAGGTIVTISSVLGKLGAARLSDYAATKAAVTAMHRSLEAELRENETAGSPRVRMLLVTPGQLATKLFAGVRTPSQFLGPVVPPVELAREIVRAIDAGDSGEISLPLYTRHIEWVAVLPVGVQRIIRWMSGVDRAMDGFQSSKNKTL